MARRAAAFLTAFVPLILVPAGVAMADPVGPTEYRTEVVSIDPPTDRIAVDIIGGDAFVRLTALPGTTVEVVGYRGEPFLRYLPDGVVEVNENAPTTHLSDDRYGDVELPPNADPDAPPAWSMVADDGSYSWHDHRAHWMNPLPPPGGEPGEQILEAAIPIVVDGEPVSITVSSVWEQPPSPVPALIGMAAGIGLLGWAVSANTRRLAAMLAVLAVVALAVALVAYLSVPGETAPSVVSWAVVVVALVPLASVPGLAPDTPPPYSMVVAALVLGVWGMTRWDWMWAAIIPTVIPALDRAVTALVLVAGIGLALVMALRRMSVLRPDAPL